MRLIDADAIMPKMQREMDMQELYLPVHFQQIIVDEMPTVDTAPTVLCRQCKHYHKHEVLGRTIGFCERGTAFDPRMYFYVPEDGFCNFGKVKKKMTNGDKVRAMTDEELAEYLNSITDASCAPGCYDCRKYDNCIEAWLDWLKQEVDNA